MKRFQYIKNCVSVEILSPSGALRLSALCEHGRTPRFYQHKTYIGYEERNIVDLCRDFVLRLEDEGYFVVGSEELMAS